MPPKKETTGDIGNLIVGFDNKECKLLAAALLSMTSPDKYNWELFAELTGNTEGSLKKMWPPIKKKAMEAHPSFTAFLGSAGAAPKATSTPKATPKKRKSGTPDAEESIKETTEVTPDEVAGSPKKKKKAPAKGRGRPKKTKTEEAKVEPEDKAEPEEDNSADGGDGPTTPVEEEA